MIHYIKKEEYFVSKKSPLAIEWRNPQQRFPIHGHQFTELLIITEGTATHIIDGMEFTLTKGDVFIIKRGVEHGFANLDNLCLVNVIFDRELVGIDNWNTSSLPGYMVLFNLEPDYRATHKFESKLQLSLRDLEKTLEYIKEISNELTEEKPGFEVASIGLFMTIVTFLSRCYSKVKTPNSISLLRLSESINYIEKNYLQDITIQILSDIAGMSVRNYQRVFTKTMNLSPKKYIIQLRLKHASELLQKNQFNITEIAYNSGFNDSNYFTRQFKKKFDITPKAYRDNK